MPKEIKRRYYLSGGIGMIKLIKRMYKYFQGKAIWEAKMSEPLHVRIISTPREGVRKH